MIRTTFSSLILALTLLWASSASAKQTFAQAKRDCLKNERSVSCAKAGMHLEKKGKKTEAVKYYKKACKAFLRPVGIACYLWGMLLTNKSQAHAAFVRGCGLKDADACTAVGSHFAKRRQINQALVYFKKGCTLKDGRGCHRVARWLFRRKKAAQAVGYLKRSCALKYPAGCGFLGWYYEVKKKDQAKAKAAYVKGCSLKGSVECARMGLLLAKQRKYTKALRYLRRSCKMGFRRGCRLARKLNARMGKRR